MNSTVTMQTGSPASGTALTCAQLRDWVRQAQPGARQIYGHGGVVAHACTPELRALVMHLYERGYLRPHRTRADDDHGRGGVIQIVVRTDRPVTKGDPLEVPKPPRRGETGGVRADIARAFGGRGR